MKSSKNIFCFFSLLSMLCISPVSFAHPQNNHEDMAACLKFLQSLPMDKHDRRVAKQMLLGNDEVKRMSVLAICGFAEDEDVFAENLNLLLNEYHPQLKHRDIVANKTFATMPIVRDFMKADILVARFGDFVDVNGDGMTDFVVSWMDDRGNPPSYYRATFLSTGKGWIMAACESSSPKTPGDPFIPCN